jgi:hypothetical protein
MNPKVRCASGKEPSRATARQLWGVKETPGEVSAGMAVARGVARRHRIGLKIVRDDWNVSCCRKGGAHGWRANGEECIDFEADEVRRRLGQPRWIAGAVSYFLRNGGDIRFYC